MKTKLLKEGVYSIIFSKSFTLVELPIFNALAMSLEKKQADTIILDMEKLELIDSMGISHLNNFIKSIEKQCSSIVATGANPRIRSICLYRGLQVSFEGLC